MILLICPEMFYITIRGGMKKHIEQQTKLAIVKDYCSGSAGLKKVSIILDGDIT